MLLDKISKNKFGKLTPWSIISNVGSIIYYMKVDRIKRGNLNIGIFVHILSSSKILYERN